MTPVTETTIPPQGPNYKTVEISVDSFFEPTVDLAAIARIDTLFFQAIAGGGVVLAVPDPIFGNTEVDLSLLENAEPPPTCP
jgi:hypothetical protein